MKKKSIVTVISLSLFFYILIYFTYQGIRSTPESIGELDSLGYHIPIAKGIITGNIFKPITLIKGLGYYPAIAEIILIPFLFINIPTNFYNVLGIVLLFITCYLVGKRVGLARASIVFAVSVTMLNSVVRLIPTQRNDIWLAIFYLATLVLLQNPRKSLVYFFKLGLFSGLLIGVKYSGPAFAIVLLGFYLRKIITVLNFKRLIVFLIPLTIFGLSWYIRNLWLTGNPIYPGSIFGFIGHTDFDIQIWHPIKSIRYYDGGLWLFIQTMISEYLIWSMLLIVIPIILLSKRKIKINSTIKTISLIGLVNFVVYLLLPSWPINFYSDARYLFPAFILLILSAFLIAKKYKLLDKLYLIAILSSASVFLQIAYRPKIIFIWLIGVSIFLIKSIKLREAK